MKQKTMQELNEQYKDCLQRENEYTVCGQKMVVVSHFIGDKDFDDELYRLAFDRALNKESLCYQSRIITRWESNSACLRTMSDREIPSQSKTKGESSQIM